MWKLRGGQERQYVESLTYSGDIGGLVPPAETKQQAEWIGSEEIREEWVKHTRRDASKKMNEEMQWSVVDYPQLRHPTVTRFKDRDRPYWRWEGRTGRILESREESWSIPPQFKYDI